MEKSIHQIRSLLVVPSISERNLEKIFSLENRDKPDAIIFDLEDAISPDYKSEARETLERFLLANKKRVDSLYTTIIRINAESTKYYKEDIKLMKKLQPDFIGPSKVQTPIEINKAKELSQVSKVFVPIETLSAAINYKAFIDVLTPDDGILVGYEDLSADLMIKRPPLDTINPISFTVVQALLYARHKVVTFFDAVYAGYKTEKHLVGLRNEANYTKSLGAHGKVCIHPSQVSIVNEIFDTMPLKKEAKNILDQIDITSSKSVVGIDNELIGPPLIKYYMKVLEN